MDQLRDALHRPASRLVGALPSEARAEARRALSNHVWQYPLVPAAAQRNGPEHRAHSSPCRYPRDASRSLRQKRLSSLASNKKSSSPCDLVSIDLCSKTLFLLIETCLHLC